MEITKEIRDKIFAQYLGQSIKQGEYIVKISLTTPISLPNLDDCKLILKPLLDITDEEAIEVHKILGSKMNKKSKFFYEILNSTSPENAIEIYQFLQYKGYDMPHYLLNGQTLKESGLAIYE